MRFISIKLLLLLLLGNAGLVFGHEFWITGVTGRRNLSDISKMNDLKTIGVKTVVFYSDCPVKVMDVGAAEWKNEESRKQILDCLADCDKADIAVIPLLNLFYENDSPEQLQVSRWSDKPRFRCFSAPTDKLIARLEFFVGELSKYKSFTGICIDDEPGVFAGGCVCERCKKLFKEKYRIEAPANDDFLNARPGVIPDDHPILLWNQFQKGLAEKYYAALASAIRRKNPAISVLTIPAVPFYSGKQLSIPNCTPALFAKSGRMVTLDACHIQEYQMYNQFYLSRITADGWNDRLANGLCLYMMGEESVPQFSNVPIYDAYLGVSGRKEHPRVISPLAFKRFVLQTFSEGAKGIVYFPADVLDCNFIGMGKDALERYIQPACQSLGNLRRPPGQVGVFYSSTTRAFADIWKENPIERYRHLHACDALAYYLFRKGAPFEMIMEDEIKENDDYARLKIILTSGVRFIDRRTAQFFKRHIQKGGQILCDPESAKIIPGSTGLPLKTGFWYEAVKGIHPHPSDLEFQAGLLDCSLGDRLTDAYVPCHSSSRLVNVNYLTDGKDLYLFLVADVLDGKVESHLTFDREYDVTDVLEKKELGLKKEIVLMFFPGTLRILRLMSIPK